MGIISTLFRLGKAKSAEAAEKIEDANALPMAAQDLREVETELETAKNNFATIKASLMKTERDIATKQSEFEDYKAKAKKLVEAGNNDLAEQVAKRAVNIRTDIEGLDKQKAMLAKTLSNQQENIEELTETVEDMKRDLENMRAQEMVTKSTESLAAVNKDGIASASGRFKRYKERQQANLDKAQARLEAETSNNLDDKIEDVLGEKSSAAKSFLAEL